MDGRLVCGMLVDGMVFQFVGPQPYAMLLNPFGVVDALWGYECPVGDMKAL